MFIENPQVKEGKSSFLNYFTFRNTSADEQKDPITGTVLNGSKAQRCNGAKVKQTIYAIGCLCAFTAFVPL